MTKRRHTPAYPAELRERGVRLFLEQRSEYSSDTAACRAIAPKLGVRPAACGFGASKASAILASVMG